MSLFFIGIVEMVIVALWTRAVTKANVVLTGLVTGINIFIWYYVVGQVIDNLHNWRMIVPYGIGCAIGSMIGAIDLKNYFASAAPRTERNEL
jgi:uncharacterized protein YebE (UPF0316 family)